MARVLLGLGTNVGDRAANLRAALMALRNVVAIRALSDIYESEPYGHADQGRFWNMAVAADTDAAPDALLRTLQALEIGLGRVRTFRMGPRVIDIDILFCDDVVLQTDSLTIPHAGVLDRAFVLRPVLDIAPGMRHPVTGIALTEHLAALDEGGLVRIGDAAAALGGLDAPRP